MLFSFPIGNMGRLTQYQAKALPNGKDFANFGYSGLNVPEREIAA